VALTQGVVAAMSGEWEVRLATIEARVAALAVAVAAQRQALATAREQGAQAAADLVKARLSLEALRQREQARRTLYSETEKRCYDRVKGGVDVLFKRERDP
jgi:outer membrane protein TolC